MSDELKPRVHLGVLSLAIVVGLTVHAQDTARSPMFGHDAQHTSRTTVVGPQNETAPRTFTVEATGTWGAHWSPVVGADGSVYIGHRYGLVALHAIGLPKWNYFGGPVTSQALGPAGGVYLTSPDGLVALTNNDRPRWTYPVTSGGLTIGSDGTIYMTAGTTVHAVNPDGTAKWTTTLTDIDSIPGTAAVGPDGRVYIAAVDIQCALDFCDRFARLYALSETAGDAELLFTSYPFEVSSFTTSPVIGPDGTIYVGALVREASLFGALFAFSPTGFREWRHDLPEIPLAPPALSWNGSLYLGIGGFVYAVALDGTRQWTFESDSASFGFVSAPAVGGDGTIYIGSAGGAWYALDPAGTLKWRAQTNGASTAPAIGSGGVLYVGIRNAFPSEPGRRIGRLQAFGT